MGIIRTLLALAVVFYHSYGFGDSEHVMTGGTVSVQAFYIISGFYMALIINEKYAGRKNAYRLFLTNRFLRIYPVYWATLLFVILVCVFSQIFFGEPFYLWYWESHWTMLSWGTIIILILSNIFLLGSDALMFTGVNPETGNLRFTLNPYRYNPMTGTYFFIPQIWTVGLEISFYLIAPFVVRTKWYLQTLLTIGSFSLFYYLFHSQGLEADPWTYRFFPTQLGLFMLGSLAYQVYSRIKSFNIPKSIPAALWAIVVLIIVFYPDLKKMIQDPHADYATRLGFCWYFYGILFVALPFVFHFFKDIRWDRFIGELSFPIYVCHHIIMYFWRKFFFQPAHSMYMDWFGIATAVSSVVFAILLYKVVIIPLEKIRQRRVLQNAQLN